MSGGPEVRQQLAEALPTETVQLFHGPQEYPTWEERLRTADALLPAVERIAAERAAEALGEALSISATRGPHEAVAWMARRHAEAMDTGRQEGP